MIVAGLKYWLTRICSRLTPRIIARANVVLNYLETGRWMREHGYSIAVRSQNRQQVWERIAQQVSHREVLYLKFGVAKGRATRWWLKILTHPDSRLHGFDTFNGLPEDWKFGFEQGRFSNQGIPPVIPDARVQFFTGLFQQTLPTYNVPEHQQLILNLDADLYSSTIYVLNHFRSAIVPGSYLYFDEFSDRDHELRAFDEFSRSSGRKFELIGTTRDMTHVAFRCVA